MALINCPECGKEISDKASSCIHCGFPLYSDFQTQSSNTKAVEEQNTETDFRCKYCGKQNEIGSVICSRCGLGLVKKGTGLKGFVSVIAPDIPKKEFNGVYKIGLTGKKEVYCPRCKSDNCQHYQDKTIIPAKTKTKYTANLNPLHPFTLVNKKEKVVKKEKTITEDKFICNSCGKIFS